ncbi:MAG: Na+/H+ antiporter subunit E [Anaerolineales bacterium]|jgi:multicomponent Na+:H+ antiporter subunit E|nr:Na+/H+ antiporter subunit E [Anaerolineales bacterium]MBX3006176.1 Na+/H+ antiporter subunit E [Anaerolineales bacterium]MCW5838969.1 Na+/H+ antiporter subunit E [Anaerolineales bacterium]MCW5888769.1 Na+/H+ antiporter subunit E [Anaerolineales bacterium]
MAQSNENKQLIGLLIVNACLAIFWYIFFPGDEARNLLLGFAVGALALSIYHRGYGLRIWWLLSYLAFVAWEIVLSNAKLTWWILHPKLEFHPGIVAVPLTLDSDFEITVLVTMITLTPGTVSVDLRKDRRGRDVVYIHSFFVKDADSFRHEIKETFERRLSLVTRGGWQHELV